jgi:DNA-binding PadR family transcriptional regulator
MLELAALGLLQREPLHGYRLTKHLELFMGCCMTINYGAVYPLLRRLEQRGYVATLTAPENVSSSNRTSSSRTSSSRILYRITAEGQQHWLEKMNQHPNESWVNSRSRFMIKVFFFQDLDPQVRINLLEHRLMQCQLRRQTLQDEKAARTSLDPYQLAAFEHGTHLLEIDMDWLQQLLKAEQSRLCHQMTETLS